MRTLKYPDPFSDQTDEEKVMEAQLRSTLRQDLSRTLQCKRPLLTHLNADTTWLLSLPVPDHGQHVKSKKLKRGAETKDDTIEAVDTVLGTVQEADCGKTYFHILIDP